MTDLAFFVSLTNTLLCLGLWIAALVGAGFLFARLRMDGRQPYGRSSFWILLCLLPIPFLIVTTASRKFHEELRKPLESFAPTYTYAMLALGLEEINLQTNPDDPKYQRIIEAQKNWVAKNPFIADVYVFFRDSEGQVRLLIDSETDYNRDGIYEGDRESRTDIGEPYDDELDKDISEAFDGNYDFNFDVSADRWGRWLSAYYPVTNSSGHTSYVIGVDFPADSYESQLAQAHLQSLLLAACFFGLVWAGALALGFAQFQLAIKLDLEKNLKESQLFAENVQRIAKVGGWELEPKTGTTRWTSEVYRIYGLSENTATDKDKGIHYYALHDQERITKCVQECLEGKPYRGVFEFVDAQGNPKWVEASGEPVFAQDGTVTMLRGTFQDVSQKVQSERESLDLREELTQFFEVAIDLLCIADTNANFKRVNQAFTRVLGYSASELVERPFLEFVHPDDVVATLQEVEKLTQGIPTIRFINRYRAKDGSYRVLSWATSPSPASRLLYAAARDITEELAMQKTIELERAKSLHNSKLASLGEMSAGIAHEINNPLTLIVGNLPLLKKVRDDEAKFHAKLDTISRAAARIDKIVGGLRRFARASDGVEHKIEALHEIVKEALVIVEAKIKRHATQIEVNVPQDIQILCDAVEIEQVLINLINNSVDANKGQSESWVKIEAFNQDSSTIVRIIDSGQGISKETEEKLFQPFFTTKSVGEGTGLGLSITKGILDSHQATIHLDRTCPNTCFEICFTGAKVVV
jgi:PAS domain S-box-containing protein